MKHIKLISCGLFLLGMGIAGLQAQEVVPAAGGDDSGIGGSVSYTVGQVVYTTNTGTNGTVVQGIQQSYEISVVSAIEKTEGINIVVSAYPNPTADFLMLKIDGSVNLQIQSINYTLFDIKGKLLESKKIEGVETNIVMRNLVPATYFLKIIQNNIEMKTFKIIKY